MCPGTEAMDILYLVLESFPMSEADFTASLEQC